MSNLTFSLQRQVQTSELMMLDRMFLADEQQSLIRLRQDHEAELLNMATESIHATQGTHAQLAAQQEKAQCNSESNVQVDPLLVKVLSAKNPHQTE